MNRPKIEVPESIKKIDKQIEALQDQIARETKEIDRLMYDREVHRKALDELSQTKRELVEDYNLKYKYSSDFDWCIRILKKSNLIFNSNQILVNYLEEGLTTQNRKASLKERFQIMVHYYGLTRTLVNHVGFVFRLVVQ